MVVIGGLISSLMLTLVLVPVLYLLVERRRDRGSQASDQLQHSMPTLSPPTDRTPAVGHTLDVIDLAGVIREVGPSQSTPSTMSSPRAHGDSELMPVLTCTLTAGQAAALAPPSAAHTGLSMQTSRAIRAPTCRRRDARVRTAHRP